MLVHCESRPSILSGFRLNSLQVQLLDGEMHCAQEHNTTLLSSAEARNVRYKNPKCEAGTGECRREVEWVDPTPSTVALHEALRLHLPEKKPCEPLQRRETQRTTTIRASRSRFPIRQF